MKFDLSKPHCYYFSEIAKIPHGSGNEKALSDWICSLAAQKGLAYIQDALWNVVVYLPATPGYESHPGVIVQAHIDMVCEKTADSAHDFEKDPLKLYVDGTLLRAEGTTLGADDAMGAAYMLDIMMDEQLQHPYLELCFTVQEEVGLVGAMALKPEYFKARRLINLDGGGEVRTYTTLAGARSMVLEKPMPMAPAQEPAYKLSISGLLGGRTGDDIGKERANAWKLAARALYAFHKAGIPFRIAALEAPEVRGIAAEAAVLFTAAAEPARLEAVLDKLRQAVAAAYEFSDPAICLTLEKAHAAAAASIQDSLELVQLLHLLPFGVMARFLPLDGLPCYSANISKVALADGVARISCAVRSPFDSYLDDGEYSIGLLCKKCGAAIREKSDYYGYRYMQHSPLRDTMDRVYMAYYGKPLQHVAAHGGNECGAFKHMFPEMDIVTSGAIYDDPHTPQESLDLESFDRAIGFLKAFLCEL